MRTQIMCKFFRQPCIKYTKSRKGHIGGKLRFLDNLTKEFEAFIRKAIRAINKSSVMKTLWGIGAFLGILSMASLFTSCTPLKPEVVQFGDPFNIEDSMSALWHLNETTTGGAPGGKDFGDSSGSSFGATKVGTLTLGTTGKVGKSVQFNRSGHIDAQTTETFVDDVASIGFWMNWDGTDSVMPFGFDQYSLLLSGGSMGFHTGCGDLYGASGSAAIVSQWVYIVAEFHAADVTQNKLYVGGMPVALSQIAGAPCANHAVLQSHFAIGSWLHDTTYRFEGNIDEVAVWRRALTPTEVGILSQP